MSSEQAVITLTPIVGLAELMASIEEEQRDEIREHISSEGCTTKDWCVYAKEVSFQTSFTVREMIEIKNKLIQTIEGGINEIIEKIMEHITGVLDTNLWFDDYDNLTVRSFDTGNDQELSVLPVEVDQIFRNLN